MHETLFRNPVPVMAAETPGSFDTAPYTFVYDEKVPLSLELGYLPTSEFDRHQHVFYMAALEGIFSEIDLLVSEKYYERKDEKLTTCFEQLSDLNAWRSIFEMHRDKDEEAVFFASRVTTFKAKLMLFESAFELGNSPVLMKLGDLRAEAARQARPLEALTDCMLSEITLGLGLPRNVEDFKALLQDGNNTSDANEQALANALMYAGVKAMDRQDDEAYHKVLACFEKPIASLFKLRLLYDAAKIQTVSRNRQLTKSERGKRKKLKSYCDDKLYKKDENYDEVYEVISVAFRRIGNSRSEYEIENIFKEYRAAAPIYMSGGIVPDKRLKTDKDFKSHYAQALESLDPSATPKIYFEMMQNAAALALTEQSDNQDELAGQIGGQIETTRIELEQRQAVGYVDLIDKSRFRTAYNRKIETLATQASSIGDLLLRFDLLCEILELQLEHDDSKDSKASNQLRVVKALGTAMCANKIGLYDEEAPHIRARCEALVLQLGQ